MRRRESLSASERECEHAHTIDGDEENRRRTSTNEYDTPKDPPDPSPPPDKPARPEDEPPSAELEGEWKIAASCKVRLTGGDTDSPGVSRGDEDPRNRPKGAQNASEHQREHSEQEEEENSPRRARVELGDPGSEAHIEDVGKRQMKLRNESKQVSKRSERTSRETSPTSSRPGEEPA